MTDLREALDSAIDELSEETHGTPVHRDGELPEAGGELHAESAESEDTAAEPAAEEDEGGGPEAESAEGVGAEEAPPADAGDGNGPEKALKAPVGWSPKARENWTKLPLEVQQQITEREQHIAQTLEQSAGERQIAQSIGQIAHTYGPLMATEGFQNPLEAIQGLFNTANKLRNGTEQQRATQLAEMVKYYGIDIGMLDTALSGQQPDQGAQANSQMADMIDQRMAPINQFMEQLGGMQQQNQQQQMAEANQEIANFKGEFKEDLRFQMADFIDMAGQQGRQLSLQEAYDMAVASNPEIAQLVQKRQHDAELVGQQQNIAGKRAAAGSVPAGGQPAGDGGEMSLRDQLESAWGN